MGEEREEIERKALALAQGAFEVGRGDLTALDRALQATNATTEDIARAAHLSLTTAPFSGTALVRVNLETRLQVALMREHVEAQRRMGRALNLMTALLVVLTAALLVLTVVLVNFARRAA